MTRDGLSIRCDIPATGTMPRPTTAAAAGAGTAGRQTDFCANVGSGGGEGSTEPLLQPIETAAAAEVNHALWSKLLNAQVGVLVADVSPPVFVHFLSIVQNLSISCPLLVPILS